MGHAGLAVKMLTEASESEAMEIATYLEAQNRSRQAIERIIVEEALAQLQERGYSPEEDRAVVLGSQSWHPGVIGIVAARLVERLCRPTVLVALNNGHGKGSGRSVPGFHLANALAACGEHLISHGGHEMAAGLSVAEDKFEGFREAFCAYARRHVEPEMMTAELKLEGTAPLNQMTEATVNDLHRLGPFGQGNRKPLFCFRDVKVAGPPKVVGKSGEHLQLLVRQGNARIKCIAFRKGALAEQLKPGVAIELAAEPTLNEFNGRCSVELDVKDLRLV
jgi:single-stranded-DNA-specific exonuclease